MKELVYKILVAEDDELLLEIYNDILDSNGYSTFPANNPYTALQIIKNQNIDLAILDYNLPIMTGIQLGDLIKKVQKNTRFFFISGNPNIWELVKDAKYQIDDVFSKPVNIEKLLTRIHEVSYREIESLEEPTHRMLSVSK